MLYLDAANPRSYPGTGTAFNDLSGLGSNFTIHNGAFVEDSSVFFDGDNDNVGRSTPTYLQLKNDKSLFFWFNQFSSTSSGDNDQALLRCGLGSDLLYCVFAARNTRRLQFHWYNNTFLSVNSTSFIYNHDQFNYGGVVITGDQVLFYMNGNFISQGQVSIPSPASASLIGIGAARSGGAVGTTGQDFYGRIAQASIYNRALTSEEVLHNFNTLRSRFSI